jgi:cytosine deaminase
LDAFTPFEAVRQRADVLASIRNGEYLFKRPEPSYEIELDVFRSTTEPFAHRQHAHA